MSVTIKDLEDTMKNLKAPKSILSVKDLSEEIHDILRDKLQPSQKLLLIASIFIALTENGFKSGYTKTKDKALRKSLITAVQSILEDNDIPEQKGKEIVAQFDLVVQQKSIHNILRDVIVLIDTNIFSGQVQAIDHMGEFYKEFIRYAGSLGDGIHLTPSHITGLFTKLANKGAGLDHTKSVVFDPCAGTGGFLVAALRVMFEKCKTEAERKRVRKALCGIELDTFMFALLVCNMIFHGDGKSQCYNADSLHLEQESADSIAKLLINVCLMNPPYAVKGIHEFEFVLGALSLMEPGGSLVAIIPSSCVNDQGKKATELKDKLLKSHTLEAVMSMPDQLFPGVGTITCVVVFTASKAHPVGYETWFALWTDDGFKLNKGRREEKKLGVWDKIEKYWVSTFTARKDKPGYSIRQSVDYTKDWSAEAYLETDPDTITQDLINDKVEDFVNYLVTNNVQV